MNKKGRKYTQYKGLRSYHEIVSTNPGLNSLSETIKSSPNFKIAIKSYQNKISIDEEWVKTIETYLPFVSEAILEGRRFILNSGETVDIEKIKRVSKDSVVDLAKHSDKIRKFDFEKTTVEPRKLLIVEKNDDYGLYENKFLVYLIALIDSFISVRYDKIKDAQSSIKIESNFNNDVTFYKDSIQYDFNLIDIRQSEFKIEETDINKDIFLRIESIVSVLEQFKKSDLISIVKKMPPISEPIQKNNVLKNDPNFVKCFELYEYLKNYKEDGFIIEKEEIGNDSPSETYISFFKFVPLMLTFLSYSETKKLFDVYNLEYEKEKEEAFKKNFEKLKNDAGLNELSEEEIVELINFINKKIQDKDKEIESLNNEFNEKIRLKNEEIVRRVFEEQEKFNEYKKEKEKEILELNEKVETLENENNSLKAKIEELSAINSSLRVSLNRGEKVEGEEISEEEFNNLEKDFEYFIKYFDSVWKDMKKEIKNKKKKEIRELYKRKRKIDG